MVKTIDIQQIRDQFPILKQQVNGKPLVYFDNAATSQKPLQVIQALVDYYSSTNANIHRGIHHLAEKATAEYEETRLAVKNFINAESTQSIVFTRGTTESINLVAATYGRANIKKGDEVIISGLEHHSNIVPWQMLCEEKEATLKVIPVNDKGELLIEAYEKLLSEKTKIVAVNHVSNTLGTINPIKTIIDKAHKYGAKVLIDGAQSALHLPIDVQALDCDFYATSSHKMYGPTGVGILYGKKELLEAMPPYQGGGEMIAEVTFEKTTYNELPYKYEAGTPNIGDTIAFKAAIDFVNEIGKEAIAAHEDELLAYATEKIKAFDGISIIGEADKKVSVLSFSVADVHHQDLGIILDNYGVAIRTGHHCTQPLMDRFCIPGTSRASFAVYNTKEEIDIFIDALGKALKMLR